MAYELFDETANAFASGIDRSIAAGTYERGQLFVGAVARNVAPGGRVLDYGCGPGRLARLVATEGYEVEGIDPSAEMIREACRQNLADLRVRFEARPEGLEDGRLLETSRYDGVVCSSVVEYVADARALLENIHRSLRPSGALVISYANRLSLWRRYAEIRFGATRPHFGLQTNKWTFREFERILATTGFDVVEGPTFFESVFDTRGALARLSGSGLIGTLGLVVARKTSR